MYLEYPSGGSEGQIQDRKSKSGKIRYYPMLIQKNCSTLCGENVFFSDYDGGSETPTFSTDLGQILKYISDVEDS